MFKFSLYFLLSFCVMGATAQSKTIVYKESNEDMLNPERGFYIPTETKASKFNSLNIDKLKGYRTTPVKAGRASYAVNVTLVYRAYELDIFKDKPLSDSFLINVQQDFDIVRAAGEKIILRFAYTNTSKSGDCGDEYKICPPYGDAPRDIVLNHIRQLKPLLQKNADIIAVMQEGFIGIWGENYFTDYFGDASTNGVGKVLDSSWLHRNELLKTLLEVLPESRMVQVRTPQIKQKFVYGPAATVNSRPLQLAGAFKGTDQSRVGFHNDCFLSSPDDYGTYYDYGSSTQQRQPANEVLRKFIEADTKFTAVGGETCDDAFSPQNDCAPAGHAEEEMHRMHYSYLNASYNPTVSNDWDSAGCLYNIRRKLGYRFVLQKAVLPAIVKKEAALSVDLTLNNIGYASPFNARPVKVVLRNAKTKQTFFIMLKADPRFWFSGINHIKEMISLPPGIKQGIYQVLLYLPDADSSLDKRPEYCIQLANENVWEPATGYNNLHHSIRVQ